MSKKILGIVLVVIVVVVGIVFGRNSDSGTVKIGVLLPLTGGLASYGEPAQKVAELAVADINAAGGINGRKLEIVYQNHKCDPKEAVTVFEKLLTSGIKVFNSVACSGTVASIAPNLVSKNVVFLGTLTSASKLTGISPNFFRNWASDRQEGKILADQIIKQGYKNVAIIYEETDYAKGLKMDVESNLKDKGITITVESFASSATDVRTQLTKLKTVKPDALLVSVQTVTTGEIVLSQMEQLKFTPKMLVNYNILKATALVKNHSALLEGARGGDYALQDSEKLNKVLADYKAKYGVDCPQKNVCAMEYDAIQLLAQALSARGDSAEGVREYLSQNTYAGVSGNISFDAQNDRTGTDYVLFGVKGGEIYRVLE
jgi:branched-chain amino acid transport system substrate-binding protein